MVNCAIAELRSRHPGDGTCFLCFSKPMPESHRLTLGSRQWMSPRKPPRSFPTKRPEFSNGSRWVEDDFSPVDAVHEPVERVVPPIANVHRNPAKLGLEHGVAQVSLHVVSGLKKKNPQRALLLVPLTGNTSAFLRFSRSDYHR